MSTPEHRPQDVPSELFEIAYRAWEENTQGKIRNWSAEQQVRAIVVAVLPATYRYWFTSAFGTREEIEAREAEARKRPKDDMVDLCERLRPGEHERQVREHVAAEIADRLLGWTRGHPDGGMYLARLSCGHAKPVVDTIPPGDGVTTWCPVCRVEVGVVREITRGGS